MRNGFQIGLVIALVVCVAMLSLALIATNNSVHELQWEVFLMQHGVKP
jgi:hypothetical protein